MCLRNRFLLYFDGVLLYFFQIFCCKRFLVALFLMAHSKIYFVVRGEFKGVSLFILENRKLIDGNCIANKCNRWQVLMVFSANGSYRRYNIEDVVIGAGAYSCGESKFVDAFSLLL